MDERIKVTRGSGNIFADLELPDPEGLLRKADEMIALRDYIRRRRLSTATAVQVLDANLEEVGALRRGKFNALSVERIEEMYGRMPESSRSAQSL